MIENIVAELEWAKDEALAAMGSVEQEFCVGQAEHDAARRAYDRMTKLFEQLLAYFTENAG